MFRIERFRTYVVKGLAKPQLHPNLEESRILYMNSSVILRLSGIFYSTW